MSDLRMIKVLVSRELLKVIQEPSRVLGIVLQPLIFWVVIGSGFMPSFHVADNGDLNYQDFFFVGVLAMVLLFSAIFSTITLIEDRSSGLMQAILVAPGSRGSLVFGKVLGVTALSVLQAVLLIVIGALAGFPLEAANWFLVFGFLVLGGMALSGLGFVFAWGSSSTAGYHALMSVILIPMWILSGAMFPPNTPWMKVLVLVNPIAWLVSGLRAAFAGGVAPVGSVTADLTMPICFAGLVVFSVLILALGTWVCRRN